MPHGHPSPALILAFVLTTLSGCGPAREDDAAPEAGPGAGRVVRVTATWRERIALPPGAALEATVEDVAPADAPADVIGRVRLESPGNPPIRFEIPYDSSLVDPARRYTVRVRVLVEGEPFFTSDRDYPVLGADGAAVEVLLRRGGRSAGGGGGLEGTRWRLTEVNGEPVTRAAGQPEPYLTFDAATGRVAGSGGCNQFGGDYRVAGDSLTVSRIASTLKACAQGMETEQALLQSLERVRRWTLSGGVLELIGGNGQPVARFEAGSA